MFALPNAAPAMAVLPITRASLTERRNGGDVAATPKRFFRTHSQMAVDQQDADQKRQKAREGGSLRPKSPCLLIHTGLFDAVTGLVSDFVVAGGV
jgi:hypothetical protein